MKAGAYGNWKKSNERFDPSIVKQKSRRGASCVSAVGEMLLRAQNVNTVTQAEILAIIGEPAPFGRLQAFLNELPVNEFGKVWQAGFDLEFNIYSFKDERNFAVILKEYGEPAHAVFIKRIGKRILINDTFDQSSYEMTREDFEEVWTGAYIYYGEEDR